MVWSHRRMGLATVQEQEPPNGPMACFEWKARANMEGAKTSKTRSTRIATYRTVANCCHHVLSFQADLRPSAETAAHRAIRTFTTATRDPRREFVSLLRSPTRVTLRTKEGLQDRRTNATSTLQPPPWCRLCQVKLSRLTKITLRDLPRYAQVHFAEGIRAACHHEVSRLKLYIYIYIDLTPMPHTRTA